MQQATAGHSDSRARTGALPLGAIALIILAAIAPHVRAIQSDFCYDDVSIVAENPNVVGPAPWTAIWTSDYWGGTGSDWANRDLLYRPVAVTSYRVVYALFAASPAAQHTINLILHALLSVLIASLALRLELSVEASVGAGLLFAVLPIHSEAVISVVGRADILAALGAVAAILAHRRTALGGGNRWAILSAACVFVAMGAKESGLVAVPSVIIMDWYFYRYTKQADAQSRWLCSATLRRLMYLVVPLAAYLVLRMNALEGSLLQSPPLTRTINLLGDAPIWQRALGAMQLWGMYWSKTLWPQTLCVEYSINSVRLATSVVNPMVLLGTVVVISLIWAARKCWLRGDARVALLAALCLLAYLPVSNSFTLIRTFFAERVWYLPSIWVVLLAALALTRLPRAQLTRVVLIAAIIAMAARVFVRTDDWRNNDTLFAAAYRDHPDGIHALRLYGGALADSGQYEDAANLLKRAIEIDLGYTDAYRALGRVLLKMGRYEEALHYLQSAEMQVPNDPQTQRALDSARAAVAQKSADRVASARQSADAAPNDVAARLEVVKALRESGDLGAAVTELAAHDAPFASDPRWAREYAVTLVLQNDLDGAIEQYQRVMSLDPGAVGAGTELAMLLIERNQPGDLDSARKTIDRLAAIAPNDVGLLLASAELAVASGRLQDAIDHYRRAIALEPRDSPRRAAMVQRLRALGG